MGPGGEFPVPPAWQSGNSRRAAPTPQNPGADKTRVRARRDVPIGALAPGTPVVRLRAVIHAPPKPPAAPSHRDGDPAAWRALRLLLLLAPAATLWGCGGPSAVERRDIGSVGGAQEGWQLVLAPEDSAPAGAEQYRLDATLASRAGEQSYPLDMYPQTVPTLERARWLYFPVTPGTFVYFPDRARTVWSR